MISLGAAAMLNLAVYEGQNAVLPTGWRQVQTITDDTTGLVMGHYACGQQNYLAVRGVWDKTAAMSALRVFLGEDPIDRIASAKATVARLFGPNPDPQTLAVGGHSLGGLVAAALAEHFNLPGLAQNAPGWMTRTPDPSRLQSFLQVRTARDVVGDWGSAYPRNLVLPDPQTSSWSLASLHNLDRQNQLIFAHDIGHCRIDDHHLAPPEDIDPSPLSVTDRFSRALGKLRAAHQYTRLHDRLRRKASP